MSHPKEHFPSYDSTMDYLYSLAKPLGPSPNLPESLKDVHKAAEFLNYIDEEIIPFSRTLKPEEFILKVGELTKEKIPDVGDGKTRANISLRVWPGCLDSAKTIRDTYVDKSSSDGILPYTPEMRKDAWYQKMKPKSEEDALYKYGVELVYLEGIPSDSIIRKHVRRGKEGDVISLEDIVVEG